MTQESDEKTQSPPSTEKAPHTQQPPPQPLGPAPDQPVPSPVKTVDLSRRIQEARERWGRATKVIAEAAENAERLTESDFAIRINARE